MLHVSLSCLLAPLAVGSTEQAVMQRTVNDCLVLMLVILNACTVECVGQKYDLLLRSREMYEYSADGILRYLSAEQ